MPATTAGTAYGVYTSTLAGAGTVNLAVSDRDKSSPNRPLILYCHGAGGGPDQFTVRPGWSGMRDWLIDNGWAWVECTGGGLQPWGNTASRAAYRAAFDHADTVLDVGPVVVLGRSMGALVAYWLYTQEPTISARADGLIVNSGVSDLAAAYASGQWTTEMHAAYDVADASGFAAASSGHDPILFPLNLWDGTAILQLVGTADTTVPPDAHGLAMRTRYAGRPAVDLLDTRVGGDHSEGNGSYLQVDAMASFLEQVAGTDTAAPPPAYRVNQAYITGPGGTLTPVSPQLGV